MTRDGFWKLLEAARAKSRGGRDELEAALDARLREFTAGEIEEFARHYAALQNEANSREVWEAACVIGCGESDDGYADFLRWVVLQGEREFKKVTARPDSLAAYERQANPIEDWYSEYDPREVYESVAGRPLPEFAIADRPAPAHAAVDPAVLEKRFPKLSRRISATKNFDARRTRRDALFLNATLERIEDCDGVARLVFSTGAEIRIRDYWPYYCARYGVSGATPSYEDHPLLGQTVVSIAGDSFPQSFYMWFGNRRKLSLGYDAQDCREFEVVG